MEVIREIIQKIDQRIEELEIENRQDENMVKAPPHNQTIIVRQARINELKKLNREFEELMREKARKELGVLLFELGNYAVQYGIQRSYGCNMNDGDAKKISQLIEKVLYIRSLFPSL